MTATLLYCFDALFLAAAIAVLFFYLSKDRSTTGIGGFRLGIPLRLKRQARRLASDPNAFPARLMIIFGGEYIRSRTDNGRIRLNAQAETTVGSDGSNVIAIELPSVADHHGKFFWRGAHWCYEDTGGKHSWIRRSNSAGEDPVDGMMVELKDGDTIRVGQVGLLYGEG